MSTMQAAVICETEGTGKPHRHLQLQTIPRPVPSAHQLLVKVHATALNRADLMQVKGFYNPPAGESEIVGLELAGEVVAWGDEVTGFSQGQRVFGLIGGGGYAEYAVIDAEMAMLMPDTWTYQHAAALPEVWFTAHETLFQLGRLQMDESVLIHAAGSGVGTAAVQMAKQRGARVFVTAGSDEKLAKLKALGADVGINYKTQSFAEVIKTETNGQGVNLVQDFIGAAYLSDNIDSLAVDGRLVVVSLMGGSRVEMPLNKILLKRLQVMGSAMRSQPLAEKRAITQRFMKYWLPVLAAEQVNPVIDCSFPLADIEAAHTYMKENKNFGKVIITVT